MPDQSLLDDLRLAHILADQADAITMARFKATDLRVDSKPDLTPVTDADTAVEDTLRNMLGRTRPRDAVHGEERADSGWGPRRWVIDPIDGTANFVRGVPVWATLIGLMVGDEVVAGVVSAPALSRRWWASRGSGAFTGRSLLQGLPCRTSAVAAIEDASLSYSSIGGWVDSGRGPAVRRPDAGLLAHPRLRRLLELHAAGRRCSGRGHRAGTRPARHGCTGRSSSPRPAAGSPTSTATTDRTVRAPSRRTGSCTTRCSRGSPPTPWCPQTTEFRRGGEAQPAVLIRGIAASSARV